LNRALAEEDLENNITKNLEVTNQMRLYSRNKAGRSRINKKHVKKIA